MSERDDYSTGDFTFKKISLPPIKVDCSQWQDTTDGEWTRGTFVVRKVTLPPIKVDCSKWTDEATIWLELRLAADAAVSKENLLDAARLLAPELNLVADETRTRQEGESLIVALRPTNPPADVEDRLSKVIREARSLTTGTARVTSAALCWAA